jgi:comEA protein
MEQQEPGKQNLVLIMFVAVIILFLSSAYRYSRVCFRNSDTTVYVKTPASRLNAELSDTSRGSFFSETEPGQSPPLPSTLTDSSSKQAVAEIVEREKAGIDNTAGKQVEKPFAHSEKTLPSRIPTPVETVNNYHKDTSFAESSVKKQKININKADTSELQTLPGIGVKRAEDIIRYRQTEGAFTQLEQIMKIRGIGKKTFERIKDLITVE